MFPLPKPYVFGKNEWKERDFFGKEKIMPETFKLSVLENHDQTELFEKENKLLNRYLGTKILMNWWLLLIIQKLMKSLMNFLIR